MEYRIYAAIPIDKVAPYSMRGDIAKTFVAGNYALDCVGTGLAGRIVFRPALHFIQAGMCSLHEPSLTAAPKESVHV